MTQEVTFGKGPLQHFIAPKPLGRLLPWADNSIIAVAFSFPAAQHCDTSLSTLQLRSLSDGYQAATNLPSTTQLQNVATGENGNGAWRAAGWASPRFWTGELTTGKSAAYIIDVTGGTNRYTINDTNLAVVCLRP